MRLHVASSGATVEPATIQTLRERLGATARENQRPRAYRTAIETFGQVTLAELEDMTGAIAEWQTTLPPTYRYAIMRSVRQVLTAAVRWKLIRENPAKNAGANAQPQREEVAFFESLVDVDRLAFELGGAFGPIAVFGVETGLRPSEMGCAGAAPSRPSCQRCPGAPLDGRRTVSIRPRPTTTQVWPAANAYHHV